MSQDRTLIDAIKAHLSRKATAHLRTITADVSRGRWSAEAVVAAGEVLHDRTAGVAREPDHPEAEDEVPPELDIDQDLMALGILSGLFTGVIIVPNTRRAEHIEQPDLPAPFGPNMAWLAVATTDTEAVANAVGLRQLASATWMDGIEAAHRGSVFVTPPVGDWTLVVGTPLFHPPDQTATGVEARLRALGAQFEEVEYFCSLRDPGLFAWGVNRQGTGVRGYGWLGAEGRVLWDTGAPTDEELQLGFRFDAGHPPRIDPGDGGDLDPFTEEHLFQLAARWSVDPMALDGEFTETVPGLLGKLPLPTEFQRRRLT